ncbi:hypothetical protein JTE90_019121 [Oedothorax gibbosus]|uniref:Uncharacterized protein n=1 Tax=Oedothorax gibbosus TaxID=931172 RepID=A0AAV6V7X9_9ARAC|nr:hypothetical protein JTE90_019121 [Oedothorax gibbosus]
MFCSVTEEFFFIKRSQPPFHQTMPTTAPIALALWWLLASGVLCWQYMPQYPDDAGLQQPQSSTPKRGISLLTNREDDLTRLFGRSRMGKIRKISQLGRPRGHPLSNSPTPHKRGISLLTNREGDRTRLFGPSRMSKIRKIS